MLISLLPLVQFGGKDRIYNHNTELPLLPNCPGSLYMAKLNVSQVYSASIDLSEPSNDSRFLSSF